MGSMGSWVWFRGLREFSVTAVAAVLICAIACAPKARPQTAAPAPPAPSPTAPAPSPAAPVAAAAADALPDGPGKKILTTACVACHALTEVTKFRGFYTRPQWRDIVQTMVDYGAPVGEKDVEVLTDYLTEQLGKK
jgi:cytochrome c5